MSGSCDRTIVNRNGRDHVRRAGQHVVGGNSAPTMVVARAACCLGSGTAVWIGRVRMFSRRAAAGGGGGGENNPPKGGRWGRLLQNATTGPESRATGARAETTLPAASCLRESVSVPACGNCQSSFLLPFHSGILAACMCIADGPPPPSTRAAANACLPLCAAYHSAAFGGPSIALVISTAVARVR